MRVYAAIALAALTAAAPQAARACVDFQATGSDLNVRYDPFNPAPIERVFTLRVQRLDPSVSAVRFIVVDGDAVGGVARIGQGPDGYDIRSVRDGSRPLFFRGAEQPNASNGLLTSFGQGPGGDIATETLRLSIPAGRDTPAGDYFEPLEVRFTCQGSDGVPGAADFQLDARFAIDLRVPEILSTYVGAPGVRRGQIAFGPLNPDGGVLNRDLVVTAQSTVPYGIEIDRRRGRLQRRDDDAYGLDYDLRLSGAPVTSGVAAACARTPAPAGRAHTLQVALSQGQAARVPAGAYGDVVTLNFTPRLGLSGQDGCVSGL